MRNIWIIPSLDDRKTHTKSYPRSLKQIFFRNVYVQGDKLFHESAEFKTESAIDM